MLGASAASRLSRLLREPLNMLVLDMERCEARHVTCDTTVANEKLTAYKISDVST